MERKCEKIFKEGKKVLYFKGCYSCTLPTGIMEPHSSLHNTLSPCKNGRKTKQKASILLLKIKHKYNMVYYCKVCLWNASENYNIVIS